MKNLKRDFDKGTKRRANPQMTAILRQKKKLLMLLEAAESEEEKVTLETQLKAVEQAKYSVPYTDPFDSEMKRLQYVRYIMTESLFKTYATKYSAAKNRSSMRKEMSKRRIGKDFGVQFETKSGTKTRLLYNEGFARKRMPFNPEIDRIPLTAKYASRTSLIDRLKAKQCEFCGKEDCEIEIHHVRKLKDLSGKSFWEAFMIARRRKTLALCQDCHDKLHSGKLN